LKEEIGGHLVAACWFERPIVCKVAKEDVGMHSFLFPQTMEGNVVAQQHGDGFGDCRARLDRPADWAVVVRSNGMAWALMLDCSKGMNWVQ